MNTIRPFKIFLLSELGVYTFTHLFDDGLSYKVIICLTVNILLIYWLDKKDKRELYKFMLSVISFSRISRKIWVWFVRFLAMINAAALIVLGVLTQITKPDILATSIAFTAAIYFFWYLMWQIDQTSPIDRRIINCFAKNNFSA